MRSWRKHTVLRTAISYVLSFCMLLPSITVTTRVAWADAIIDEAKKGQDTGVNFLLNYTQPTVSDGPALDPLGPNQIGIQDLFPGYDPADPSQIDNLSNLANDPSNLSTQGVATQFNLQGGTDETAEAYQGVREGAFNPHAATIDIASDNFLDRSREIIAGDDPLLDEILTACAEDVTAGDPGVDTVTRLEDIWTCSQQRQGTSGACTVERSFVLSPVATQIVLRIVGDSCASNSGGNDLSDNILIHGVVPQLSGPANICSSPNPTHPDWVFRNRNTVPPFAFTNDFYAWFCGERDIAVPTVTECVDSGQKFEHACRNSSGAVNGWQINPSHPTFGASGTCSSYAPEFGIDSYPTTPVDYTGCDAQRISYCEAARDNFVQECGGCGTCSSGLDISDYAPQGWTASTGPTNPNVPSCVAVGGPAPPGAYGTTNLPPPISTIVHLSPGFCGEHDTYTPTEAECAPVALSHEHTCRNDLFNLNPARGPVGTCAAVEGPGYDPFVDPVDYTGCDTDRISYCTAVREEFEAECTDTCDGGGGASAVMNGTETITSPAIGPGTLEVLEDQAVFGGVFDFEETAFNPGDYGLIAGEYVIADHVVVGPDITSSTIDDNGSYGTDWDFTFTATAVDATELAVEATLYEIVDNGFVFTGCSQADVQNVDNGTCSGAITCTDYTPPCRIVDGVQLCENPDASYGITQVLTPWSDFTTGIPEMCWAVDVQIDDCVSETNCIGNPSCVADCDDLPVDLQGACLSDPCWTDAQGVEICLDSTAETWINNLGDAGWTDDCRDLLDDVACELQPEMACVIGMEDPANPDDIDACQLRQRFFDCGTDVTVPGVPGADDTDVTCGAEIRCFGDECANTVTESNPDFVRAAVAATAVTESTKDMKCDVANEPESCTIFDGTDNRCRDPKGTYLGIVPDCCDESRRAGETGGDFITYMQLVRHSYRLARDPIIASWLAQGATTSALQNVVNTPANIRTSASRAVVSGFNSALEWAGFDGVKIATETAANQGSVAASTSGFGPLQQFIATGVNNFLDSIGADAFADALFTTSEGTVTGWGTSGLGQMVGTALTVIGLIYTIYSILKILGNIIFACEEEELAFGIQQVNRMCHHVGTYCSKKVSVFGSDKCVTETETYCCFASPFARIINEQLRLQGIGPDWGDATMPNCEGIPISELQNVDWSLVDLSEWEAIIFEAGLVPDPRNPPLNLVPTDRHPGEASGGDEGRTSTDLQIEIIDLVMDPLDEGRFALEGASLCQPDPDLMPWYEDDEGGC